MRSFSSLVLQHRLLIWEMTRREVKDRYTGQVFGALWAIGHPIFLMLLYIVIFNFIFPARIGDSYELPRDLSTYILAGLIPWLTFQEVLSRAATAISGNSNLVKQIVFPIEILPVKTVLAALPTLLVGTALLMIYGLLRSQSWPWTYFLLPLLWLALLGHMIALSYLISGVGVYLRDIKDVVGVFSAANLFMMPILFVPGVLPGYVERLLYLNPFSYMVWAFQDALYFGRIQHPLAWVLFVLAAPAMLALCFHLFTRFKVAFGDRL